MGQTTETDLRRFIRTNFLFGDETRLVGNDDLLVESGIIDSTGILELIEYLEEHFGIEVLEDETVPQNLGSLSRISAYLDRKMQPSPALDSSPDAPQDSASPGQQVKPA